MKQKSKMIRNLIKKLNKVAINLLDLVNKVNKLREYRLSSEVEKTLEFGDGEKHTLDNSTQPKINQDSTKYKIFEWEISDNSIDPEEQFNKIIDKNFGRLVSYFEEYFEKSRKQHKYVCDSKRWKIKELLSAMSNNAYSESETEDTQNLVNSRFLNRFNSTMRISNKSQENPNAESYLRKIVASSINMKSMFEFYANDKYDEGKCYTLSIHNIYFHNVFEIVRNIF